jgi:hypothetical protein
VAKETSLPAATVASNRAPGGDPLRPAFVHVEGTDLQRITGAGRVTRYSRVTGLADSR